jgi:hypothetical protein
MARIIAIDPGTEQSGWVEYDSKTHTVYGASISDNSDILAVLGAFALPQDSDLAIEMVDCYGMPVGRTTFETCVWIGRFIEAWGRASSISDVFVYRRDVKLHLCNSARAKDANVRQAIIDQFEPYGGGKTPQIGIKAKPGPLYGVKEHIWSALGVALTYAAQLKNTPSE